MGQKKLFVTVLVPLLTLFVAFLFPAVVGPETPPSARTRRRKIDTACGMKVLYVTPPRNVKQGKAPECSTTIRPFLRQSGLSEAC